MNYPVAILAGGLGRRLRPSTDRIPKVLTEIAGKPFAVHQIELLRSHGFRRLVFCVGHLGEMVEERIGSGEDYGIEIGYSYDGPELLGTGGALRKALSELGEAFFTIYGDSYLPCDFARIEATFDSTKKPALMTILHNANRWDRSNVFYKDGRIISYENRDPDPDSQHIDYGVGVFLARVIKGYPRNTSIDLGKIYQDLIANDQLAAYENMDRFYEIGSSSGLEETRQYLTGRLAVSE